MPRYIDADALIISLAKDRSALVNNFTRRMVSCTELMKQYGKLSKPPPLMLCLWCVGSGDKASFQHIQECHLSLPHIIAPTARERRIGTPTMASSYLVFAPTVAQRWRTSHETNI